MPGAGAAGIIPTDARAAVRNSASTENLIRVDDVMELPKLAMIALFCFSWPSWPRHSSRSAAGAEMRLRHQLIVLRRRLHGRVRLTNNDRWFFIQLYRWFPSILQVPRSSSPDARALAPGRLSLRLALEVACTGRATANRRRVARIDPTDEHENPLWGAPRIHGELLKLGFEVAQRRAKYMVKRWGPPSQGWRTFLRNHAPDIAAMDLFVVPTIGLTCSMLRHRPAGPQRPRLDQRHKEPDSRVGCTPAHRGISLEWGSALYDPGTRSDLRRHYHAPTSRHAHPR